MSTERSASRGRGLQSTGRGGVANIRAPSVDLPRVAGPEDFSDTRGRDPVRYLQEDVVTSTGRGGTGNLIRSPSREDGCRGETVSINSSPSRPEVRGREYDRDLISAIDTAHDTGVYSSGRGGTGNIVRTDSKSRSRSRDPRDSIINSSGRGGVGNLYVGSPVEKGILEVEENERAAYQHPPGVHSTGRGGQANLTPVGVPYVEAPVNPYGANHPHATHQHDHASTGRGGAGNMDRSRSREPNDKERHAAPGLSEFLHRATHTGSPAPKGEAQSEVLTRA